MIAGGVAKEHGHLVKTITQIQGDISETYESNQTNGIRIQQFKRIYCRHADILQTDGQKPLQSGSTCLQRDGYLQYPGPVRPS
jgi:hypothetical protein